MSFAIRSATEADIESMQSIEVDAGRRFAEIGMTAIADDDPPDGAILAAHVRGGSAWVADDDASSDPVGYVISSIVDTEAHIDQVSVVLGAQGRGVGTALIAMVESWGEVRGLRTITLTTFRDVEWNAPLYERRGFVAIASNDLGPELAAIRNGEIAAGIDAAGPRIAMRKSLIPMS